MGSARQHHISNRSTVNGEREMERNGVVSGVVIGLLLLVLCGVLASCGSTRRRGRSSSGRKYRPLKCPCDRRSDGQEERLWLGSEVWAAEVPHVDENR